MTVTIPDTVEGFEDVLSDPSKLSAYFDGGKPRPEFGEFVNGYVKNVTKANRDLQNDAIREQVEAVFADMLKDEGGRQAVRRVNLDPAVPPQRMPANRADRYRGIYNGKAPGALADPLNLDLATIARATYRDRDSTRDAAELRKVHADVTKVMNSFASGIPSDGGLLIPETLRAELLSVALETSVVRPRARVIPMDSLRVPFPILDLTSNASTVFGGVTAYWTEEAADYTASSPKFGRVVLDAKKLTARADLPNELLQDAVMALDAYVGEAFPQAVAWFEDIAYMRGTGVGEPLGWNLTANSGLVTVTKRSGQAADTIVWENIVDLYARMFPSSLGRAVWVANINTFPELATMALSVGTGGSAIWVNNGVEGPPMTILGRPVIFTEKMETLGDAGDIAFVDLGYYLIGDRMTMTMAASEHSRFTSDETVVKFTQRVDGAPAVKSAVTPNKGSTTLSPFVRLGARA